MKLKIEKELRFPDGSYHCQVGSHYSEPVEIDSQGFDFLKIAYQKNALYNTGFRGHVTLHIPYIPSARQDRICNFGEPFSAKVIGQLINHLGFDKVRTVVPHSDVIGAVIDNLQILELEDVFNYNTCLEFLLTGERVFVAPDAGAAKRTLKIAQAMKCGFVQANKVRDTTNGQIKSIEVPQELNPDVHYIVVDDVCAKGGTFLGLHEALIKKGAKRIDLAVAHVDLDNGIEKLAGLYDRIFTTNSQADYGTIFSHLKNVSVVNVFA